MRAGARLDTRYVCALEQLSEQPGELLLLLPRPVAPVETERLAGRSADGEQLGHGAAETTGDVSGRTSSPRWAPPSRCARATG